MSEIQHWFKAVFFGMLGHRRGEAEATETRREIRGAAATDTPGVSAIREQQPLAELPRLPEPPLLVNPSPERLLVFACISLQWGKREQGQGRSRMPK